MEISESVDPAAKFVLEMHRERGGGGGATQEGITGKLEGEVGD